MQKYIGVFLSLLGVLWVNTAWAQCNYTDPLNELPWIQTQIDADLQQDIALCNCDYEVYYGCYEGNAVFVFGRGPNSICTDIEAKVYDAQGMLLCVDGGVSGGDCFTLYPTLFEEMTIMMTVWNDCASIVTDCILNLKVFLGGALLNTTDGLMRDDLRQNNHLPTQEPYTALADFTHIGGGGETVDAGIFDITGPDAIVDWVLIEWRNENDPTTVVLTTSALLQRDGDVVGMDGISPLDCGFSSGLYFVSVRHRNHLGAMMLDAADFAVNNVVTVDFSSMPTWGNDAITRVNDIYALWAGNILVDDNVSFQGPDNDTGSIFFEVLMDANNTLLTSNYISAGYQAGDVDMDGTTIYQGANSDANYIFFEVLQHAQNATIVPNYIIYEQLP